MAAPAWSSGEFSFARFRPVFLLGLLLLLFVSGGCLHSRKIRLRDTAGSDSYQRFRLTSPGELEISHRTRLTLRSRDLEKALKSDPVRTLTELKKCVDDEPTLDLVYAFAELSFQEAERREQANPKLALEMYVASAMHAYGYLFDPRFNARRNSYDPHFREACLFYNGSLEKILRAMGRSGRVAPPDTKSLAETDSPAGVLRGSDVILHPEGDGGIGNRSVELIPRQGYAIRTLNGAFRFRCERVSGQWEAGDLEPFKFVSDYEITGLQNEHRQYGVGVPLLARRKIDAKIATSTKYTPHNLTFPVTALLRFLPPGSTAPDGSPLHAVIELYDPLTTGSTLIARQQVPLESDLTTPIAYAISDPRIASLHTIGLVRSDLLQKPIKEWTGLEKYMSEKSGVPLDDELSRKTIKGLYMMQPYEPGKIPVIFIHGLWSSPMTWTEMFNSLRGEPELRDRYQFYFYFYPTGQPFWVSAAQLREDLEEYRNTFDPQRRDPLFDRTILIGHSMGGLIAHLQTIDSGNAFWELVGREPPEKLLADQSPEMRREVAGWFFFQANPSISRVVSIATPFHGSDASNDLTQWAARKLIKLPQELRDVALSAVGREESLSEHSLLKATTSIASLASTQPVFAAIRRQRPSTRAHYHNIIGDLDRNIVSRQLMPRGDGVVTMRSAELESCESRVTVPCDHMMVQAHPKTILEVRRILFEHLRDPQTRAAFAAGAKSLPR